MERSHEKGQVRLCFWVITGSFIIHGLISWDWTSFFVLFSRSYCLSYEEIASYSLYCHIISLISDLTWRIHVVSLSCIPFPAPSFQAAESWVKKGGTVLSFMAMWIIPTHFHFSLAFVIHAFMQINILWAASIRLPCMTSLTYWDDAENHIKMVITKRLKKCFGHSLLWTQPLQKWDCILRAEYLWWYSAVCTSSNDKNSNLCWVCRAYNAVFMSIVIVWFLIFMYAVFMLVISFYSSLKSSQAPAGYIL